MVSKERKRVVICGVTGSQGGWVYDALKDDPQYELIGFSRNVANARLKFPQEELTLLEADLTDLESLVRAFQGAHLVFGVSQPWNKDYTNADVKSEVLQGSNIVKACLECNVEHLVFSSSAHEPEKTGLAHVDSKIDIEAEISKSGLSYTILQPVQFADNVGLDFFPIQSKGWIRGFVDADAKVPYVACRDIGMFAKAIFDDPAKHDRQCIWLIGDTCSGERLAQIVTKLRSDQVYQYYAIPRFVVKLFSKEFSMMRDYFEAFGRDPKAQAKAKEQIQKLKEIVPDLSTMEDHLKRVGWATRELPDKQRLEKRKQYAYYALVTGVAASAVLFAIRRAR